MPDPEKTLRTGAIPVRERLTIDEQWKSYEKRCVPENAHEIQRVECKRAFYGGASVLFTTLTTGLDGGADATELDVQYIDKLHLELIDFHRAVIEGKA